MVVGWIIILDGMLCACNICGEAVIHLCSLKIVLVGSCYSVKQTSSIR